MSVNTEPRHQMSTVFRPRAPRESVGAPPRPGPSSPTWPHWGSCIPSVLPSPQAGSSCRLASPHTWPQTRCRRPGRSLGPRPLLFSRRHCLGDARGNVLESSMGSGPGEPGVLSACDCVRSFAGRIRYHIGAQGGGGPRKHERKDMQRPRWALSAGAGGAGAGGAVAGGAGARGAGCWGCRGLGCRGLGAWDTGLGVQGAGGAGG